MAVVVTDACIIKAMAARMDHRSWFVALDRLVNMLATDLCHPDPDMLCQKLRGRGIGSKLASFHLEKKPRVTRQNMIFFGTGTAGGGEHRAPLTGAMGSALIQQLIDRSVDARGVSAVT